VTAPECAPIGRPRRDFCPTGRASTLPGRPTPGSGAVALTVSATRGGAGPQRRPSTMPVYCWFTKAYDTADPRGRRRYSTSRRRRRPDTANASCTALRAPLASLGDCCPLLPATSQTALSDSVRPATSVPDADRRRPGAAPPRPERPRRSDTLTTGRRAQLRDDPAGGPRRASRRGFDGVRGSRPCTHERGEAPVATSARQPRPVDPDRLGDRPLLLRVLGRLPVRGVTAVSAGRRRRSLRGGNRGTVRLGGAAGYGDSLGDGGSVGSVGRDLRGGESRRG
jgi:hypothetical protein